MENTNIKKVLVADDDPDTVIILEEGLKHAGFAVTAARNGEEAIEKFNAVHPDLLLLDVKMPRLNGWEVLERLKSGWKSRKVPVIMLTADDKDDDKIRGYEYGVVYYMTKPFNTQRLLNIIRNVVFAEK